LVTRSTSNIVPIGTISQTYWSKRDCSSGWFQSTKSTGQYKPNDASVSSCNYNPSLGLYYDSGDLKMNWTDANSLCLSKGMRLPSVNETSARNDGGIPPSNHYTWTSTYYASGMHWYWSSSRSGAEPDRKYFKVICVK